jgi:aldose 1-epimerase
MTVINYGGIITSLKVPDRNGELDDIVLGYDNLQDYVKRNPYFGALIGRYGNRIAKGKFTLDDNDYQLATNHLVNHLHGGEKGYDKVVWDISELEREHGVGIVLSYLSKDMEEGYPGNLKISVTYFLSDENTLELEYHAVTDKKTIVNLTQHSYFNLSGMKHNILNHELQINAAGFLPIDKTYIPTGEITPVAGTPFDFRKPKVIGRDINEKDQQLKFAGGYDHNWVLERDNNKMSYAASLYDPESGRFMEVLTEEPGLQFYSGNFLDGSITGKYDIVYKRNFGLCLETQHYPDSPNNPEFPSVVLNPGEEYSTKTVYKFSVK